MRRVAAAVSLAASLSACGARTHASLNADAATTHCRATVPVDGIVRWARPDTSNRRAQLDAWCAATGPLLFIGDPGDAREPPSTPQDVVFASWNVHVGHADLERFITDLRAGALTGTPPAHIVVLLQEALRERRVPARVPQGAHAAHRLAPPHGADVEDVARRLGLAIFYAPSMRDGGDGDADHPAADRGNAILSSLPLADPLAIELPLERQRHVAVAAAIPFGADGARAFVISAHLDTLGRRGSLWVFGASAAREREAVSLAAAIPPGVAVLGADLNTWTSHNEPAVRTLLDTLPASSRGAAPSTARGGLLLDYLFFRLPRDTTATTTRAPSRYGSDHFPLIATIAQRRPPA